jgi:BCD family chlorophyll transporter-like MFS transporter
MSRAIGKLLGGGLLDLGRQLPLGPGPFPAFALVLSVEALVTFGALLLLASLNVHQFRQDTASSLERVLSMEMG